LFAGWLYSLNLVIINFLDLYFLVFGTLLCKFFLFPDVFLIFIGIFASELHMFENVLVSGFILIESHFCIVELD
jgi:hypothetical protein